MTWNTGYLLVQQRNAVRDGGSGQGGAHLGAQPRDPRGGAVWVYANCIGFDLLYTIYLVNIQKYRPIIEQGLNGNWM